MTDAATHVADNLRQLRKARGLTQAALARAAGVPRPTLATIEAGGGNPTLSVLVRVAAALRVTLEELVSPPRADVRHVSASELPAVARGDATIRRLLPDPVPGLVIERIDLPPGGSLVGTPHTPGTREYLSCERGRLDLFTGGTRFSLKPGDVVVFRGDQRHSYRNGGSAVTSGLSVVVLIGGVG